MPSEPVPLLFHVYFYGAIILGIIASMTAIVLYRRSVQRNMLPVDASPVPPATSALDSAAVRASPIPPASDYAAAEHYVKNRLALVYSAAILAVVFLVVWIRFFTGNTTLIRGSIMFLMWRLPLGTPLAFALSSALFAAIGIPLLAVLLAWRWRRALAAFALYVGLWAACAFVLMISLYGWKMANWASTLVLAQVFIICTSAWQPFLLMLLTGNRRVRAIAPMTLAGSILFCALLLGAFMLAYRTGFMRAFQTPRHWEATVGAIAIGAIVIMLSLFVCWLVLRLFARLYEKKTYSDRQLLVDCWSLVVILYIFARLGESPGTPALLIAIAFLVFIVYRLLIHLGLRLLVSGVERPPPRRLLLLRTFGFQKRTEKLFDAIGQRWRFHGDILMIAGTDLAARTIDPADYLRFLSGRLRHQFIKTEADLEDRLGRLDDRPDPDGRYRVNELFCAGDAWYLALVALLDQADVVLMDLRGFSANNQGCVFELRQLVERGPVGQVFLTVDKSTDRSLLDVIVQETWRQKPEETRRHAAADLKVLPIWNSNARALDEILTALQGDKELSRPRQTRWRTKAIVSCGSIAVLLLISFLAPLSRQTRPGTNVHLTQAPAQQSNKAPVREKPGATVEHKGDEKAMPASDGGSRMHYNLGVDLANRGDRKAAMEEFRKALELKPSYSEAQAHHNLGVLLDHERAYKAAIQEYRKALAANPKIAVSHYNLGADLDLTGDAEAAMIEYRKAIALDRDLADAHYNLGVALDGTRDYGAAMAEYREALRVKPDMADAHYNLGVDLFRKDEMEASLTEFGKALAAKPDWLEVRIYLAGIQIRRGQPEAAVVECRKAVELKPDQPETHYCLAMALRAAGKTEEAEQELGQVQRLNLALKRPQN